MVPSAPTTLFEATIPYTSLRPLSRVLVGLSRIGDELCFEATTTKVMLSAVNLSKSAFGIVTLNADAFFTSYKCRNQDNEVRCKMQIRLLLSVFKARNIETRENKDSGPESCQIRVVDNPLTGACRFIIRLLCKHGVVKTHQLTYASTNNLYAVYNAQEFIQHFQISSKLAKDYLDHFQSRIEELDIYSERDRLIWNGFTEGFTGDDAHLLKQPLQTQVSLSTTELDDFKFETDVHVVLTLRDFKAAVQLAENLQVPLLVSYSRPGKPCVVTFERESQGIECEFVMATITEIGSRETSTVPTRAGSQVQPPRSREVSMVIDGHGDGHGNGQEDEIGWGAGGTMSPARSPERYDDEDIYGEPMQEDVQEEVPPTQQERYQGLFDI